MRKAPDLFSFSAGNLPTREASTGSLPPIVEEIFTDSDGVYAEDVERGELYNHPQIVAAIAAECPTAYVTRLLEAEPEIGCAVVYGTLMVRGTPFFLDILEIATDSILEPGSLSDREVQLILHAVQAALSSRDVTELEQTSLPPAIERFHAVRTRLNTEKGYDGPGNIEDDFPTFARYRFIVDEVKRSTVAGTTPHDAFFGSIEPTMDNYLKAVLGSLSKGDSPIQRNALEFFAKLDGALLEKFTFGLERHYLSNKGPSPLVFGE